MYLTKGSRIHVQRIKTKLVSLAGVQMKTEAQIEDFWGTVEKIRGDHPTNPTAIQVWVRTDGGQEVRDVELKHIIEAETSPSETPVK